MPIYGQNLSFRNISTKDGLTNGTINSLTQDKYGFIWLATWDGLMKYDGYNVKSYFPHHGDTTSLPSRRVRRLLTDSDDNVWCLTPKGLSKYNNTSDNFANYSLGKDLDNSGVFQGFFEMNRILYVQVSGHLYYLPLDNDPDERILKKVDIEGIQPGELGRLLNFDVDKNQEVFLCQRIPMGANRIKSKIFTADNIDKNIGELKIKEIFEIESRVHTICSDKQDRIFAGTQNGLFVYNRNDKLITQIPETQNLNISYLFISSTNKLWIGTNKDGLAVLDLQTGKVERYLNEPNSTFSIASNVIYSIYEDFSGNLWISHGGKGISILNLTKNPFETDRINPVNNTLLAENTVFSFNETESEILIGTNFDGLSFMTFDKNIQQYILTKASIPQEFTNAVRFPKVWHIEKESPERFWLGTNFGLILAKKNKGNWIYEKYLKQENSGTIRKIFIDDEKNVWVGSDNGLFLYCNGDHLKPYIYRFSKNDPQSLSGMTITSFLVDSKNNFWIGTQDGGLNLLETKYHELNLSGSVKPDLKFIRFSASAQSKNSLNNNEITCLFEKPDGKIWVGTNGGGINTLDPVELTFTSLQKDDGFPETHIFNILKDHNDLIWVNSDEGLFRIDNELGDITIINPQNSILGNIFLSQSFFKSPTGVLFFAGKYGFSKINPSLITQNTISPKLSFTSIDIFQKRIKIGENIFDRIVLPEALTELDEITISHKASEINIHYSAIHYQNPLKNTVEYRLEGYMDNWTKTPVSVGYLHFSNLPHGEYSLQLRASNSDNIWTSEPKSLQIKILPPWWKTVIARIFAIIIFLASVSGLMALLLHRQALKHALKIEKIENQNIKDLNEAKLKFFTNISHDLRTPLSLTLAPIEELLLKPEELSPVTRNHLNLANRNAKILMRLINQIMDFRKANAGKLKLNASEYDMREFLLGIMKNFESLTKDKEISVKLNLPDDNFMLWFDYKKMEQVIYNLISNALKYTYKNGNVALSLSKSKAEENPFPDTEGFAVISIFNEGEKIPADKLDKIFERFYKIDNWGTGSGIGLSLVKSFVELHKGTVKATSNDEGITFSIYLPLGKGHLSEIEKLDTDHKPDLPMSPEFDSNEIEAVGETKSSESNLTLLLVEDNTELRSFLRIRFEKEYNFFEAGDGEEGLVLAKEIIPDIIISDVKMPGMSGYDLCDKVKENSSTSHIPVLLLTAKDSSENIIEGYESGADAYIVKPFELGILDSTIKQLIKNREKTWAAYRQNNFLIETEEEKVFTSEDSYIKMVREVIDDNISDPEFNVNLLSEKIFISPSHLYRKIKALTGYSTIEFMRVIKIIRASELLKNSHYSVKEVCYMTGFNNPSYFIKCFKEYHQITPKDYSKKSKKGEL